MIAISKPALSRASQKLFKVFLASFGSQSLGSHPRLSSVRVPQRLRFHATIAAPVRGDSASLLSSLSRNAQVVGHQSRFPDVSDKSVAYWLLASAASVFGIVVFGGLTRLTESGYELFVVEQVEKEMD